MHEIRAMECERTRQWVSAALDSELSQFERALVTGHLARCAACRSFEERITAVTAAVRSSPPERMRERLYLPARRRAAWRTQTGVARLGSVAAVIVMALSVGLLTASEQGPLGSETAPVASSLESTAGINELVIEVRRRTLVQGQHQAIAFGSGGIGAYKPVLAPTP